MHVDTTIARWGYNQLARSVGYNPAAVPELGTFLDEYLHAWNHTVGYGSYLIGPIADLHRQLGGLAIRYGTGIFRTAPNLGNANIVFHQLEMLNFLESGAALPQFARKIGVDAMLDFATKP
jgi:hypothetical protein